MVLCKFFHAKPIQGCLYVHKGHLFIIHLSDFSFFFLNGGVYFCWSFAQQFFRLKLNEGLNFK